MGRINGKQINTLVKLFDPHLIQRFVMIFFSPANKMIDALLTHFKNGFVNNVHRCLFADSFSFAERNDHGYPFSVGPVFISKNTHQVFFLQLDRCKNITGS